MTASVADSDVPAGASGDAPILRWVFRRDNAVVVCELGLTDDDRAYALRVDPPWNSTGLAMQVFDAAMPAFQRHATIERALVHEGWRLDTFESRRVLRGRADETNHATESHVDW